MYKLLLRIIIIGVFVGIVWWWYVTPDAESDMNDFTTGQTIIAQENTGTARKNAQETVQKLDSLHNTQKPTPQYSYVPRVKNSVDFIVQAPQAQWHDPLFQDACEEASLLMTARWRENKRSLSKTEATEALKALFEQEKTFFTPQTIDTSVTDTARFARAYFGGTFEAHSAITLEDIYQALSDGALVIVPTNGKKLGNPHFSGDGPERHMLVITGYDTTKDEFITNDPGTRKGKNYHYNTATLYNAIRDYPTGHKEPILTLEKAMIVVKK